MKGLTREIRAINSYGDEPLEKAVTSFLAAGQEGVIVFQMPDPVSIRSNWLQMLTGSSLRATNTTMLSKNRSG